MQFTKKSAPGGKENRLILYNIIHNLYYTRNEQSEEIRKKNSRAILSTLRIIPILVFKLNFMSKYKSKPIIKKKDILTPQEKKEEAKFFRVAIIVTFVLILLMYLIYSSF